MKRSAWTAFAGFLALAVLGGCTRFTDVREGINSIESRSVPERLKVINGTYKIGPPDVLRITVRDNADLATEGIVRPDGYITFPLLRDVYVEGMTPEEISDMLDTELGSYIKDVETTVTVIGFFSKKIFVFGEVKKPGPQPFTGDVTLVEAIANAGSITIRSAPGGVRVVRGDLEKPKIFKISLKKITAKGRAGLNLQLKENDIVFVPTNGFAKVGYAIDNVLYPFRSLLTAVFTASAVQGI